MKKFLIGIGVFLVLIGAGVFAVSRILTGDNIQQKVVQMVKEKTGRDLVFDAARPAFFLPNVGLRFSNVKISNPAWAKQKDMIALDELTIYLKLRPLLDKRVEVSKLELKKPVIHIEVAADGRASWDLPKKATTPKGGASAGDNVASKAAQGITYKFGDMQIVNALVTYDDAGKNTHLSLKDVNLALTWPDFDSKLEADGALEYAGRKVNAVLNLEKPLDLSQGKPSDGDLRLTAEGVNAEAKGKFATAGEMFGGHMKVDVKSLTALAGWLKGEKTSLPFDKFTLQSDAHVSQSLVKMQNARVALDDLNAGGNLSLALAGKPALTGKLSVDHIDLDRFTAASKGAAPGETAAAQPRQDWDATPLNFNGLKAADANIVLDTKGFTVKGAEVGPSTLTAELRNGRLRASSSEATLFGGKFKSEIVVDAAGATPLQSLNFSMDGVQAKPMLTAFAGFKKLDGRATGNASLTSNGRSQKEIIGNLAGKIDFDFKNGSIEGIDLVNIAKLIQSRLEKMNIGQGKTEFVDLAGTCTVSRGIVHNDDLKMKGPLVQTTGSGDVDLPKKYVTYRALPVLTASSAVENAKGLTVPVDIRGPFNDINIKPDYKSVIQNVLGNPADTKQVIKNVREEGKDLLKGLRKNPNAAIGRLLGLPQQEQPDGQTATDPSADPQAAGQDAPAPVGQGGSGAPAIP